MDKKLTNKQNRFIEEYLVDSNGAAAYVRAGFSPNGANAGAPRLLANVSIKEEIKKRQAVTSKKLEIKREDMILMQFKISKAYDEYLDLMVKEKLTPAEESKYFRMSSLKANDATRAAEFVSKHLGWNSSEDESKTIESININIVRKKDEQQD